MNRQFSLCFALVLTSGFLGCSTAVRHHCNDRPAGVASQANVKLKFIKVDSEETDGVDNYGKNAVDGDPNTFWHTQWQGTNPEPPHEIVIELIPPAVIRGFAYLPRQDVSDHGVIKDYEFYAGEDREHFGQPVKKGAFEPGRGEQIETFEPIKCRFIKLRAISEINGLPWTSAAEIRVIQNGEDVCLKDYWSGDTEQAPTRRDSTRPDAIDTFVAALSIDGGLWLNGLDATYGSQAATPEEVVSDTFRTAEFEAGLITSYQILDLRKVHIGELPGTYTAVLADTNLGRMIVLMQPIRSDNSAPAHWWRRIYETGPRIKRLY